MAAILWPSSAPAKKFYPQEQTPIAYVDYRLGLVEDLYVVLGDFARDGSHATIKVQVNRMVSWLWIGGLMLTLGAALSILPDRRRPGVSCPHRASRWLIPIAVLPVLILLAYGFRTNPRDVPSPLIGKPAAPFALKAFDGADLSLEALRGRVVVVNFWASWCYPSCYEEAPALERGWQAYKDRGVTMIGVNIQDKEEPAKKFLAQFGHTFPNAPDPAGRVSVDYGVYGVPETFFIDRAGRVRFKHVGAITDEVLRRMSTRCSRSRRDRDAGGPHAHHGRAPLSSACSAAAAPVDEDTVRADRGATCAASSARASPWPTPPRRRPTRCAGSSATGSRRATRRIRSEPISSTATACGSSSRRPGKASTCSSGSCPSWGSPPASRSWS